MPGERVSGASGENHQVLQVRAFGERMWVCRPLPTCIFATKKVNFIDVMIHPKIFWLIENNIYL